MKNLIAYFEGQAKELRELVDLGGIEKTAAVLQANASLVNLSLTEKKHAHHL